MSEPEGSTTKRSKRSEEEAELRQESSNLLGRSKSMRERLRQERSIEEPVAATTTAEPSVPKLKLPRKKSHRKSRDASTAQPDEVKEERGPGAGSEGPGTGSGSTSTFIVDEFQRKLMKMVDSEVDPRINLYQPYYLIPEWVKMWAWLKHFVVYDHATTPSAVESVRNTLRTQRGMAEELKVMVMANRDGGVLRATHLEFEKPPELFQAKDPFWMLLGTAEKEVIALCESIDKKLQALEDFVTNNGYHPLGLEDISGLDGAQTYQLPEGVQQLRKMQLQQCILQDVVGPKALSKVKTNIPYTTHTEDYVNSAYGRMPVIHADFVVSDGPSRIDMTLLKQLDTGSHEDESKRDFERVITLTITFARFQEHELATPEHQMVAKLLTAYENYKLLDSNLKPGIRSRLFYEKQLDALRDQAETNPVIAEEFSNLERLHQDASKDELEYLQTMISCWRGIQSLRDSQPPAKTKIMFHLRRHGDPAMEPVVPRADDDLLTFVPILSGFEPTGIDDRSYHIVALASTVSGYPQAIGQTASRNVDSTLTLRFNESFELHCTREPSEIFLQLVDDKNIEVARVSIQPRISQVAFLSEFRTGRSLANGQEIWGVMSLSTNWTTQTDMTVEVIERQFLTGEADPNDPRNAKWVDVMRKYYAELSEDAATRKNSKYTPSKRGGDRSGVHGDGIIINPKYESDNYRIQQLRNRWQLKSGALVPKNHFDLKVIDLPMASDSYQVKRDMENLKQKIAYEQGNYTQRNEKDSNKWRENIRETKLRRKSAKKEDPELLQHYISQPPIPTLTRFISNIIAVLAPRSKLNPSREERPEPDEIDRRRLLETKDSQITAHIMKAVGLPTRSDENAGQVEAFVEMSFIDKHCETRAEFGPNPSWFQTLNVDFEPIDFEEETLSLIEDDVIISIYDKVYISELDPVRAQDNQTSYRTERRLLGYVKIPFYSIFQSPTASVEGQFAVLTPRWVMGYDLGTESPFVHIYVSLWPPLRKKDEKAPTSQDIMLRMSTLYVSHELHVLHTAALTWQNRCGSAIAGIQAQNPMAGRREFQAFVNNSRGDPVLICRYLLQDGVVPPSTVTTPMEAIRFVSLIPFTVDIVAWDDQKDVWSTNEEYLRMGFGDYEEMALLLIHFLRAVDPGCHCYLVLGEGDVYKQATYVLYWYQNEWKLIDPRTGNIFDTTYPYCGFSEVTMIVSHNQVWGNVQLSGSPHKMVWNLDIERYWLPMFEKGVGQFVAALDYVQKLYRPIYTPPNHSRCNTMEDAIKDKLKDLVREWRGTKDVTFVLRHEITLRILLEMMEEERRKNGNVPFNVTPEQQKWDISELRKLPQWSVCEEHYKMLQKIRNEGYHILGAPINVPYRDDSFDNLFLLAEELWVHKIGIGKKAINFAIGVYVHPYTDTPIVQLPTAEGEDPPRGEVISIWAYLVALVPVEHQR